MPRKRTRDGGDAAAAEPIAKRRSARQAAAASTKQTEDKAQVTKEEKRATPAKKPAASGKETKSDKKTESKAATMTEKKKNKDENARNKPKKNTKAKKEEEDDDTDRKETNPSNTKGQKEDNNSGSRAVSEDPDVDSIPTINPNAPRHQGEWYWLMKAEPETRSARRPGTPYYDPSSSKDNVRWNLVHVEFRKKFAVPIGLKELRDLGKPGGPLENMQMLKQSRLSVSRVSKEEWEALCELADRKAKDAGLEHETGKLVK
ncbi:hypothetical protein A9Z42_0003100 [Trichoderma parareesei]|uniref:EVE domain-containing protein n=1 Tax=Trichoderma parareesei TaxID=858221 RepID=A0A2H2ZV82_TRIPA|nr:hypothetical protein A9Z42_0003100 [Trichoderma parareesei]